MAEVTGSKQLAMASTKDVWKIIIVDCGAQHSVALTKNGSLWVWGDSKNGALGLGEIDEDQLALAICLNNYIITYISCGSYHCIAITHIKNAWDRERE